MLVVANVGTTCAEFAGVAAGFELFGLSRYVSVPAAAIVVSLLVLRGSFHRVEHVLLLVSTVFLAYIISGVLAHPDWGAALHGLLVPSVPGNGKAIAIVTATVGTTLAPWGLAFIQSYAVDKKLRTTDLPLERVDVATGALLTGVIGFFVVVACAATLYRRQLSGQATGAGGGGGGASGSEKVKTAPPSGWLATDTVPPWERAVCSTIDRPRPEPAFDRASGER